MENQFHQLRFNISEKVRLQPQQAGMRTLLELDLYPDVEIEDEGQHLKIHGYLRLHGHYLGDQLEYAEGEEDATTLKYEEIAYVILVEITLPAEKAAIEYVEAEIESSDYQIQSEFELQIDAILIIDGILPEVEDEPAVNTVEYRDLEEPYDQMESQFEMPSAFNAESEAQLDERKMIEEKELPIAKKEDRIQESPSLSVEANPRKVEQPVFISPDLKVDFDENEEKEPNEMQQGQKKEVLTEEAVDQENSQNNPLRTEEWSSWLVREKEERLIPLRMVIVQKEETIHSLATRYEVSVNLLIEMNKLSTDRLEEGQIIKIPSTKRAG